VAEKPRNAGGGRDRRSSSGPRSGDSRGGRGQSSGRDERSAPGRSRDQRNAPSRGRQERNAPSRGREERNAPSRDGRADAERRTVDQETYDGPPIPDDITGQELDRSVLAQLKSLPEKLAARVARHLVAAGRLLDEDPETAYKHALAARARAARVAVVREATGEAAYAAGHYAEALGELRAARRMNGAHDYLPVMADCERALSRPERALELARNPVVAGLPVDLRAEMTIVEAGARYDLGEVDGALRTLESAPLRADARADWVVALRYAYADLLSKAGRSEEALEWFHRAAAVDSNQVTDASARIEALERGGSTGSQAGSAPQP
jgi:tetratricopeptide (TPR) repeat protein